MAQTEVCATQTGLARVAVLREAHGFRDAAWGKLLGMAGSVRVQREILEKMIAHARRETHSECCGLLAGRDGVITAIFPATNSLSSPTVYEIAPRELFELFRIIRDAGLTHLGQYHSHLSTENIPSASDIAQAGYPDQPYFIVSPLADASPPVRAFSICGGDVTELTIEVVNL